MSTHFLNWIELNLLRPKLGSFGEMFRLASKEASSTESVYMSKRYRYQYCYLLRSRGMSEPSDQPICQSNRRLVQKEFIKVVVWY